MSSLLPPIRISKDGLKCVVDLPWREIKASDLDAQSVINGLVEQGIALDTIDTTRITYLVAGIQRDGHRRKDVIVAMGEPPLAKGSMTPIPVGNTKGSCIFPGDTLAQLEDLPKNRDGRGVKGEVLSLKTRTSPPKLVVGDGTKLSEDGSSIIATRYGHPRIHGMVVRVDPGLRFDSDKTSVRMDMMPSLISGARVSELAIRQFLESENIEQSAIQAEVISDAIEALWNGEGPQIDKLIAEGQLPDIGSSGMPELLGDPDNAVALPGEAVARLTPQRDPSPGRSVLGEAIEPAALTTHSTEMKAGDGVHLKSDEFIAELFGQTTVTGPEVAVHPCIHISEDQMTCRLDIFPERIDGSALDVDTLQAQLRSMGIDGACIHLDVLEDTLGRSQRSGVPILDVVAAEGRYPQEGEPTRVESVGDMSVACVLPGDRLASRSSPTPPRPGQTLLGDVLFAPDPEHADPLVASDGCEVIGDDLVATIYGQPVFAEEGPQVVPGLHIAEDNSVANADIYPCRLEEQPLNEDVLRSVFSEAGLDFDCIESESIAAALTRTKEQGLPERGVCIARALGAKPGTPGRVEIPTAATSCAARTGDIVATVISPIEGTPGRDVRGQVIGPTGTPPEASLEAKEGCHTSEDGKQIISDRYGEPVIEHRTDETGAVHVSVEIRRGIRITTDGLMARLDVFPHKIDGSPMDLETMLSALHGLEVDPQQVDKATIEAALANAMEVEVPQRDVPAATGQEQVEAEGWHLAPVTSKLTSGVLPGQPIAKFAADIKPIEGRTVRGEIIPVDEKPKLQPDLGIGTRLSEDGTLVIAERFGRPQLTRTGAGVQAGIRVSEDNLRCECDLYPQDAEGNPIGTDVILGLLDEFGVSEACIDHTYLAAAIASVQESDSSQRGVVIAHGKPALSGEDGHLEALFGPGAGCALPGDELARIIPAKPGTNGMDVLGNMLLPEHAAADPMIQLGGGCELQDNEVIVATVYGEPLLEGAHIQVSPGIRIDDNDLSAEVDVFQGRIGMRELRVSDLIDNLVKAGVDKTMVDETTLAQALQTARRTIDTVPGVVAATGTPALPPEPGRVIQVGNWKGFALPGDEIAQIVQEDTGQPGMTVRGNPIDPPPISSQLRLIGTDGCSVDSTGASARAEVYGQPHRSGENISIKPGIRFAEDGLSCVIDVVPVRVDGTELDSSQLQDLLVTASVPSEMINDDALKAGLERSKKAGGITVEVQAARGRRATTGEHGCFDPLPELETGCVFTGTKLGKVVEANPPLEGVDVLGRKLPPKSGVTEVKIQARTGCTILSEGDEIAADCYGIAEQELARVTERPGKPVDRTELYAFSVKPGLHLQEDHLGCQIDIYPYRAEGDSTRLEDLLGVLQRAGIQESCFDLDSLEHGLRQALETGHSQLGVTAAQGISPRHGEDGSRQIVGGEIGQAGAKLAFGMFDFKERAFFRRVAHGDVVAQISAPTEGTLGNNLFGEPLEARDGKALTQNMGPGVEAHDGLVYAIRDGVLSVRPDFIDVVDLVVIDGDVDYTTGHVCVDSGSVQISGSVLPGFEVEAPGDIEVGGMVDNAKLTAGGSVLIRGSILGGAEQGCEVISGNHVFAKLARDSKIRASGDITIQREAFNCDLDMDGLLLMETKPGTLSGGTTHARCGARLYNLGSQQWVRTELRCGGENSRIVAIREDLDRYQGELKRLHKDFGTEPDKAILSRTSARLKERTKKRLARRKQLFQAVREIREDLLDYERTAAKRDPPTIDVRETTYPKSLLELGGSRLFVETEVHKSHFWYDPNDGNIQRSVLGAQNETPVDEPEAAETDEPQIETVAETDPIPNEPLAEPNPEIEPEK